MHNLCRDTACYGVGVNCGKEKALAWIPVCEGTNVIPGEVKMERRLPGFSVWWGRESHPIVDNSPDGQGGTIPIQVDFCSLSYKSPQPADPYGVLTDTKRLNQIHTTHFRLLCSIPLLVSAGENYTHWLNFVNVSAFDQGLGL